MGANVNSNSDMGTSVNSDEHGKKIQSLDSPSRSSSRKLSKREMSTTRSASPSESHQPLSSRQGSASSRSTRSGSSHRRKHRSSIDALPSWPDPDKYDPRSLFCFRLQNPIRKAVIACIEYPVKPGGSGMSWWDKTVLVVILLNTVTLMVSVCDFNAEHSTIYVACLAP